MTADLWPEQWVGEWGERRSPFADAFDVVRTVRPLGPIITLSTLENGGWAVWDEHKGFWSPAPGKADELKRDLKQAIAEKLTPTSRTLPTCSTTGLSGPGLNNSRRVDARS